MSASVTYPCFVSSEQTPEQNVSGGKQPGNFEPGSFNYNQIEIPDSSNRSQDRQPKGNMSATQRSTKSSRYYGQVGVNLDKCVDSRKTMLKASARWQFLTAGGWSENPWQITCQAHSSFSTGCVAIYYSSVYICV